MSGDKSKILREKLGDKHINEQAMRYAVYDAMQAYADQQSAALKEVIRELINIAEILCIATELYSFGMPGVIQKMPKYKASIDKARKLLSQKEGTDSSSDT